MKNLFTLFVKETKNVQTITGFEKFELSKEQLHSIKGGDGIPGEWEGEWEEEEELP